MPIPVAAFLFSSKKLRRKFTADLNDIELLNMSYFNCFNFYLFF